MDPTDPTRRAPRRCRHASPGIQQASAGIIRTSSKYSSADGSENKGAPQRTNRQPAGSIAQPERTPVAPSRALPVRSTRSTWCVHSCIPRRDSSRRRCRQPPSGSIPRTDAGAPARNGRTQSPGRPTTKSPPAPPHILSPNSCGSEIRGAASKSLQPEVSAAHSRKRSRRRSVEPARQSPEPTGAARSRPRQVPRRLIAGFVRPTRYRMEFGA